MSNAFIKTIEIPGKEDYDEEKNEFVYSDSTIIRLEHSLFTVSKWEAKTHKPFISPEKKTFEETLSYIKCMCLDPVSDSVLDHLTDKNLMDIQQYIDDKMTATTFNRPKNSGSIMRKKILTSEIIYYWMVELNIPVEFEHWHLNRLLCLVDVINTKHVEESGKGKKRQSNSQILNNYNSLNNARLKALHTNG